MSAPLLKNPYQPWDGNKSNYNKRGEELRTKMDQIVKSDPTLKGLSQDIIDLAVPRGKHKILDAKDALTKQGWQRWMNVRHTVVSKVKQLKRNSSIAGHIVDLNDFDDMQEFVVDCYEDYLRMAQLGGRSKVTHVVEDGRTVGKKVIDMDFDGYMKDCLRNLQWRMKTDLPALKEREQMGYIGVRLTEYEKSMDLLKMAEGYVRKFLEMPPKKRFIYV